jgi:hypothetical protein
MKFNMLRFAFFLIAALGYIGIYAQPINKWVRTQTTIKLYILHFC